MRTRHGARALIALLGAAMLAIGLVGPASAGPERANENSQATITVEWVEEEGACTDFTVTSSKDISFVSVNYNDFSYEKFDGLSGHTFEYPGTSEVGIKSIVVKSGSTTRVFPCGDSAGNDGPPQCSDDQDNDSDGTANHPGGGQVDDLPFDDGCETPDDDDECPSLPDGPCPAEEEPCTDTDEDGVCDDDDDCPDTPGTLPNGCNPEGPEHENCSDGVDNDGDGLTDADDPDCQQSCTDTDTDGVCDEDDDCPNTPGTLPNGCNPEGPPGDPTCSDGVDNDGDGLTDADDPDCQQAADPCTAEADDPGIFNVLGLPEPFPRDTLGQAFWDGGLQVPPLTEDPDADGSITSQIYAAGNGEDYEPLTDELACALDLLIDPSLGGDL